MSYQDYHEYSSQVIRVIMIGVITNNISITSSYHVLLATLPNIDCRSWQEACDSSFPSKLTGV